MLRGSTHSHEWTDEELDSLAAEIADIEEDPEGDFESVSTRRRIEELRDLQRLRRTLDDFDESWEEQLEDFDDSVEEDDYDNWH